MRLGYSTELDGTRRYKLRSGSEIISPSKGEDYRIDRVKKSLGKLATVRGRIYQPVDKPDNPAQVLSVNGWSAPAAVYDELSGVMASQGVSTAVYDTYKLPTRMDFRDPLDSAERGGLAMIDIMQDVVGDDELAVIGHSMGAITGLRIALKSEKVKQFIAEAPAGIEHTNMRRHLLERVPRMISKEFYPLQRYMIGRKIGRRVVSEFLMLNATDPSRLIRQVWMLGSDPDIAPLLSASHDVGVTNGIIIHGDDYFFHSPENMAIVERKRDLFDDVDLSKGSRHLNPNFNPKHDAMLRLQMLEKLRAISAEQAA